MTAISNFISVFEVLTSAVDAFVVVGLVLMDSSSVVWDDTKGDTPAPLDLHVPGARARTARDEFQVLLLLCSTA
jgi:hypothetical protein